MIARLAVLSHRIFLHPRHLLHARSMTVTTAKNAPKSMKAKRSVPAQSPQAEDPPVETAKPSTKKAKTSTKTAKPPPLPATPVGTRYEVSMRPESKPDKYLTIMSWNVAGLRALLKKDAEAIERLVTSEKVDVLCLQEHKLQEKHVEEVQEQVLLDGWEACWSCSVKPGYSGTCILYRKDAFDGAKPVLTCGIGSEKHDAEGRVVTMAVPGLYICNAYVPNSGSGLKRLEYRTEEWDVDFTNYLAGLRKDRRVILTGDLNCAREPIDIHNAKGNLKSAGFTPEERESFQKVYMDAGWKDTFREQHPDIHGYTYYSYRFNMREKQRGWRLDYFLVSPDVAEQCHDSFILPEFTGSDHCPLGLIIDQSQ